MRDPRPAMVKKGVKIVTILFNKRKDANDWLELRGLTLPIRELNNRFYKVVVTNEQYRELQ
jgi:hypothetical protein